MSAVVLGAFTVAAGQERPEPLPVEVVLSDLREAYGTSPTAEEVMVRFRSGSGDRSDTFTVRIDPGTAPGPRPRRVLLELGQLRVHIADGVLTAINTAAPDKYYQRSFEGPVTPERLAELLPPVPLPQLAVLNAADPGFANPLVMLPRVVWTGAMVDEGARPLTLTMTGSGLSGSAAVTALVSTVRMTKMVAAIRKGEAEAQLEMTFRAVEPGDPAMWAISTTGRAAVASLTELRTTPRPLGAAVVGQPAPGLSLSKFDMTGWTLQHASEAARPRGLAVVLFRGSAGEGAKRGVRAALEALRGTDVAVAAGVVIELSEFSRERWQAVRQEYGDVMWSPGMLESIDRFAPGAEAVLVVVRPDEARTLGGVIRLDGEGVGGGTGLGAEVRRALGK